MHQATHLWTQSWDSDPSRQACGMHRAHEQLQTSRSTCLARWILQPVEQEKGVWGGALAPRKLPSEFSFLLPRKSLRVQERRQGSGEALLPVQ